MGWIYSSSLSSLILFVETMYSLLIVESSLHKTRITHRRSVRIIITCFFWGIIPSIFLMYWLKLKWGDGCYQWIQPGARFLVRTCCWHQCPFSQHRFSFLSVLCSLSKILSLISEPYMFIVTGVLSAHEREREITYRTIQQTRNQRDPTLNCPSCTWQWHSATRR